jgi:formate hydrogenlyase subunit 3/multisubunit Na+/H+ antiporter MnhD subunit
MTWLREVVLAFAPLAFIWLPLLAVPLVYILRRYSIVAATAAAVMVLLSGWLLWDQPPTETRLLGETLALSGLSRALLIGLSLWLAVAFLLAARIPQGRSLFPFLLVSYAFIATALLFQNFVVRVLLLKIAWLVAIMLVQGGFTQSTRAASRLLVMTVLALPPFLAASEMLQQYTLEPGLLRLESPIVVTLALGFSLMLAVIPFHAWLPQVAEDGPPLIASFLIAGLGSAYLVLLVDLLGNNAWLANNAQAQTFLSSGGLILIVLGGCLTLSETHLGRLWAYSTLTNLGMLLLGLGVGTIAGIQGALLVGGARLLNLLLSGGALATIRRHATTLELDGLAGVGFRLPLSMLALAIGGLGLLGAPVTFGFPGHWSVLQALIAQHPAWAWAIIAANGLGVLGYLRAFAAAFREAPADRLEQIQREPRLATGVLLGLAGLALLLALFPQWANPVLTYLLTSLNLIRVS